MAYSAYIITDVEDKILLLQANYAPKGYPLGVWMNPGGCLENSDSDILSGAIREWEEEVGTPFPVSFSDIKLLGIFSQEDGTFCIVFFVTLDKNLLFESIPVSHDEVAEIKQRKLFSLSEIQNLKEEKKIFPAQYRFISWYSQIKFSSRAFPIYNRVIPVEEPKLITSK